MEIWAVFEYLYNSITGIIQVIDSLDSWKFYQSGRDANKEIYYFVLGCGIVAVILTSVAIGQEIYERMKVNERKKRKIDSSILERKDKK